MKIREWIFNRQIVFDKFIPFRVETIAVGRNAMRRVSTA